MSGGARINPPLQPTLGGAALAVLALILSGVVVFVLATGDASNVETSPAAVPTAPVVLEQSSEPGLAIPDDDPGGVADSVLISEATTVGSVDVRVRIDHAYPDELTVELVSPSDTSTVLFSGGDRLPRRFRDRNVPELAALAGEPAGGAWTLLAYDDTAADSGTLVAWSIAITPQ